ncbi:MAG: outer membrane lipoprotein carrier protein LolA [Rhodobacteraceae bacterium]|nr:outer membrane lipoprotein carrier protein LolA [Paracoccaceae bacterium]
MSKLRLTLAAISLALAVTPAAAADKLSLNAISAYLNGLKSVKGSFTQINSDGTISTGTIYIRRPGRVRFEYNPPEEALVMAGGGQVAIFDAKSNQPPEQYPLKRTPLSIILQKNVDLARANMVVGYEFDGTATSVVAQDPKHPEQGNIRLVFSGPPVELRQWVITGSDGSETTVILGDMDKSARLASILFSIPVEMAKRNP